LQHKIGIGFKKSDAILLKKQRKSNRLFTKAVATQEK
jgi:hypothetical protein